MLTGINTRSPIGSGAGYLCCDLNRGPSEFVDTFYSSLVRQGSLNSRSTEEDSPP